MFSCFYLPADSGRRGPEDAEYFFGKGGYGIHISGGLRGSALSLVLSDGKPCSGVRGCQ